MKKALALGSCNENDALMAHRDLAVASRLCFIVASRAIGAETMGFFWRSVGPFRSASQRALNVVGVSFNAYERIDVASYV